MEQIEKVKAILDKTLRSEAELIFLKDYTKDIEFFRKLKEDNGTDELHASCCKVMRLSCFEVGEYVFHFGDRGDNYYITLEGMVEITVPPSKNSIPETAPDPTNAPQQPEAERGSFIAKLARASRRTSVLSAVFLRRMNRSKIFVPSEFPLHPQDESKFIKVADLGPGRGFGELALLKGMVRNASVKCITPTTLLSLSREDFTKLLGNLEEKRLNEKVAFLSHVQCFKNLSKGAMFKLSYYFTLRSIKRGEVVYREGDEAEKVYVILSGEFQFSKKSTRSVRSQSVQRLAIDRIERLYHRMKDRISVHKPAELAVMIKGPKEMFGEDEVVNRLGRSCSCICTKNATVYVIDRHVMTTQDLIHNLNNGESWDLMKEKQSKETQWLEYRLKSLETVEDLKVSYFTEAVEPASPPIKVRKIVRSRTERSVGADPIFQTELQENSQVLQETPLKRSFRENSPEKSLPLPKLNMQPLPVRVALFSRSARRQASNLYIPKIVAHKLSRARSTSRL